MKRIQVKFFKSVSGNEPVKDWLKDLSKIEMKIIGADVKTVEYGWVLSHVLTVHIYTSILDFIFSKFEIGSC